jgi:hypothetical protein
MAIIFRTKKEPSADLSATQKQILVEQGLLPPEPAPAKPDLTKTYQSYSAGDKVVIVNTLYSWVEEWKPGDTGIVLQYRGPVPEAIRDGRKWGLVEVRLDKPRVFTRAVCMFHAWEVAPAATT